MKKLLSLLLFFSVILNVSAWDVVGHRIVADVAYRNLTPKARKQCDKTLGVKGILYCASWADDIKSDDSYSYSYQWHFQNLKENLTVDSLQHYLENPLFDGMHLFFAIKEMKSRLQKNPADEEALKFLVHFVGDLHQPMHLGHADDLGGNRVKVKWFGAETNLHSVWDGKLIESRRFSSSEYAEYLINKFGKRKNEFLQLTDLQSVEYIYDAAVKIYACQQQDDRSNYQYIYHFATLADEMLYRAGIKLAKTLNEIYK
ncbi:MAG: S1/P1 nuclease [Paludibacter sp.]|jgi:hypothetical protein|nr:S1/P1 nuclease [Paludibacter sp.]